MLELFKDNAVPMIAGIIAIVGVGCFYAIYQKKMAKQDA